MQPEDYYQLLGLRREATTDEIAAAYRERVRHFPIGLDLPSEQTTEWLRTLRDAYETLSQPNRRAEYDASHPPSAVQNGQEAEELRGRIAAVENELARVRQQRDEYQRLAYQALASKEPIDLSEDWLQEPEGTPIETILSEHEASQGG